MPKLPKRVYKNPLEVDPTNDFPKNKLADVDPCCNSPIQIEIGADSYYKIQQDGPVTCDTPAVMAEYTALGYIFYGPLQSIHAA